MPMLQDKIETEGEDMKDERKPYVKPEMKVIVMKDAPKILAESGENGNQWWKDEQPKEDEWWGK